MNTGDTASSTPSATTSRTTSALGRMTMSAEICLIQDLRDTSARANLEVLHLTWMNAVTTRQHLCLALGTSGRACVVMSTRTRLSTLHIFPVAATARLFAKTMMGVSSSATQWTTRATMVSAGSTTTATAWLTTSARTAWCGQVGSADASVDPSSQILMTAVRDRLLLVLEYENKFNIPRKPHKAQSHESGAVSLLSCFNYRTHF